MKKRILFLVNGLGLGNSTRCHAVIQYLKDKGAKIEVITSGNGLWYFQDRSEVDNIHDIEALYYGKKDGKLSVLQTILSLGKLQDTINRNSKKIKKVITEFKPEVAVIDSVYSYTPFKKAGVPIVALNNSDVIYHSYYMFKDRPAAIKPQFYAIELMDYCFHRFIPDRVISPTLHNAPPPPC
ncbi:MAG: hypothetical protein HY754_00305 [Nitrospirae bacterium]|nr:hypothetical protein [Nitrospirota bacterium]